MFSEKFPNQCKEQTNSKVPSNILPLHIHSLFKQGLSLELQVCSYCLNIGQDKLNIALTMSA